MVGRTFTSTEAAARAGLSVRQLDHWARVGSVIRPRLSHEQGSGHYRTWTADEVRVLAVLRRLADAKAPLLVLRRAAQALITAEVHDTDTRWLAVSDRRSAVVGLDGLAGVRGWATWYVPLSGARAARAGG